MRFMAFMKVLYISVLNCPPARIVDLSLLPTKTFNSCILFSEYWRKLRFLDALIDRHPHSEFPKINSFKGVKYFILSEIKVLQYYLRKSSFVHNGQYMVQTKEGNAGHRHAFTGSNAQRLKLKFSCIYTHCFVFLSFPSCALSSNTVLWSNIVWFWFLFFFFF